MESIVIEVNDEFSINKFYSMDIMNDVCAFLSSDSVVVFNITTERLKFNKIYKRQPEELKNNGDNSWVNIINKSNIAFGTAKGSIYLYNIYSQKCKSIHTGFTITDTFVYKDSVGICVVGPKIVLISASGDSIQSINFEAPSPYIKNIISFSDTVAFCCSSFLYSGKLLPNYEPKQISENVMMISSTEDSTISADFFGEISKINETKKEEIGKTEMGVFALLNTNHGPIYVDMVGGIHLGNNSITIKDISSAMDYSYDSINDRIIFIARNSLMAASLKNLVENVPKVVREPIIKPYSEPENEVEPVQQPVVPEKQPEPEPITKEPEEKAHEVVEQPTVELESVLDVFRPFTDLNPEEKVEFLMTAPEEQFLKALRENSKEVLEVKGKNHIVESLIETKQWIRASHLSNAFDENLNELLLQYPDLGKTEFPECVSSISSDANNWKDNAIILKLLASNFMMTGLLRWSLATFIVANDKSKIRVLVEDDHTLFDDVSAFTRDYENTDATKLLKSLNIGF
ncbi:hypothetical protein TVAG_410360 [Trichomonas vaginalis G3]|uniref:Uncharacterized protein n=1 Tax=Trichomonas vaginalis (strain ATCC PRA-98 / G3) TaxID=412133 RepID=A2E8J6_TRIV3|nr:hypothetical protein TVAGG3_0358630 [Trichomonas vaginalis G3]EAY11033.1 hypothetical protein TVAG_410360 [Trichomonas vaginalis G3]KAI5531793.1 hypothetical protein TVAGG3_0358630 [Trichomonas vaginalis G3]|eukprot:XP_001323256.1 hypothetical protein [Trichomonas vaginalis G3]